MLAFSLISNPFINHIGSNITASQVYMRPTFLEGLKRTANHVLGLGENETIQYKLKKYYYADRNNSLVMLVFDLMY
jgi:hypothetical protein